MAANFQWAEMNGSCITTILGVSGNLTDFKSIDTPGIADTAGNPITAGNNSFEKWLRGHFTGTFATIRDVRFWNSIPFSPATGLTLKFKGDQAICLPPFSGSSSIATSSMPIADPGTANVSIAGSFTSSLAAAGYTDFIVMQLQTTVAAPGGYTSFATFTLTYAET